MPTRHESGVPVEGRPKSRRPGNLRQLEQFLTVAETLNFTRAAERLNIAQPALSLSIQKLEQELGAALFVREPRGVRLTRVGEAALVEARLTLAHAGQFIQVAQSAAEGVIGRLRIAFVSTATLGLLQRLVMNFTGKYPNIDLNLLEGPSTRSVSAWLEESKIDLGIVRTPFADSPNIHAAQLQQDRFVAALPSGHRYAGAKSLSLMALRDHAFVMYRHDGAPALRSAVMLACQQSGFLPRISHEVAQISTVMALVESGQGVGLVPSAMAQVARAGISLVPIQDTHDALQTGLSLIWTDDADAAVALFRDEALKPSVSRSSG